MGHRAALIDRGHLVERGFPLARPWGMSEFRGFTPVVMSLPSQSVCVWGVNGDGSEVILAASPEDVPLFERALRTYEASLVKEDMEAQPKHATDG